MSNNRTPEFRSTVYNSVKLIRSLIGEYQSPIRALAQEPVQNSTDAALTRNTLVSVVYEMHERPWVDGSTVHLLTITDSGTTGLGGPILDGKQMEQQGNLLPPDHNWAAFEGHGYTRKEDDESLGTRGEGKSALLFHSDPPQGPNSTDRMVIAYDTRLENEEYRLGVRYANPSSGSIFPPYEGDIARDTVISPELAVSEDLMIPLGLEPLNAVGTRIIIPYLNEDAIKAVRSGELWKWLQMCWWRLIQQGRLAIEVAHGGASRSVTVPTWWESEPWKSDGRPSHVYVKEGISIPSDPSLMIKRIVLSADNDIPDHEPIAGSPGFEFDGVQLLRGGQWIETLGQGEAGISRRVPESVAPRLRGFVEFDRTFERFLRDPSIETPRHDRFLRRLRVVKEMVRIVERSVEEFAEAEGWNNGSAESGDAKEKERNVVRRVTELFAPPAGQSQQRGGLDDRGSTSVNVRIDARYPTPGTSRVNRGEFMRNVTATCTVEPADYLGAMEAEFSVRGPNSQNIALPKLRLEVGPGGTGKVDVGDLMFIPAPSNRPAKAVTKPDRHEVACQIPGEYALQVKVRSASSDVAAASKAVFFEEDPPEVPPNPVSFTVLFKNRTQPERARVDDGEQVQTGLDIVYRGIEDKLFRVNALVRAAGNPGRLSAGKAVPLTFPICRNQTVVAKGIGAAGQNPTVNEVFNNSIRLLADLPSSDSPAHLVSEPGPVVLNIDIYDEFGEWVRTLNKRLWFEADPPGHSQTGLPFDLKRHEDDFERNGVAEPLWWLDAPQTEGIRYLNFSGRDPLYRAAISSDRGSQGANPGTSAYLTHITCDALLDWILEDWIQGDDSSRFDVIRQRQGESESWRRLARDVESYRSKCDSLADTPLDDLVLLRRRIVATMARIFNQFQV